jgi:hypothetical protein
VIYKSILKRLLASMMIVALTYCGAIAENFIQTSEWSYQADTVMGWEV